MTDPKFDMLDDLFAQARDQTPVVSDDLMARVLADAATAQTREPVVVASGPGPFGRLFEVLGGWPALGSLTAATVAGIWIGMSPPLAVEDMTAGLWGETVTISLFSDNDDVFDVGGLIDG